MNQELEFAKQLALKAGDIMLDYFDKELGVEIKEDGSPVTLADKKINHMVIEELARVFPADKVVGEEESTSEYGMERQWICDPIDGTLSFTWGVPGSMFSLALVIDGSPVLGVTYEPHLKNLYWATKAGGSYCNDRKLQVSTLDLNSGTVGIPPKLDRIYDHAPDVEKLMAYKKQLAVFDGAVLRGCLVAKGKLVGYPHPTVKPHDIAAVHIIIEEAGGMVSNLSGSPLDYSKPFVGAILSNRASHQQLLDLFE